MAAPYAQPSDVTTRWVASTLPPDEDVIATHLEDAAVIIDAEFPDLCERAATNATAQARARLVSVRMVMRVLVNPDQLRATTDTTGPFSGGVTYAAETLGGLYLSDEDRALLSTVPSRTQQAFSIDPTPAQQDTGPALFTSQITGWSEGGGA